MVKFDKDNKQSVISDIVLVGCGGLAVEVADYIMTQQDSHSSACQMRIRYVVSNSFERITDINKICGTKAVCLTGFGDIPDILNFKFVICIGDPVIRTKLMKELSLLKVELASVVHNSAVVCSSAKIGAGTIIGPMCVLSPFSNIGANCLINTKATIGHDTVIGDNVVIAPHTVLNGAVKCGDSTFIAANCTIHPKVKIGSYCKIAAGTVIKNDIESGFLMAGNPAQGRKMFRPQS